MSAGPSARIWPGRLAAVAATLAALAILLSLGFWQLERKAWKENLIGRIEERAFGAPSPPPSEADWKGWQASAEEYRRTRLLGTFLHENEVAIHGLMAAQRGAPVQGFYIFTPMRLTEGGGTVIVNRGFVPTELRDPAKRPEGQISGQTTVSGLARASEARGWFLPANDPGREEWFVRDVPEMAAARGLQRWAPFYIDADATPNPGGWPRGGQTRLSLPNDHLQYALTWFSLAATLIGVVAASVWRKGRSPAPA